MIKNEQEISKIRFAGKILATVMAELSRAAKAGVSLISLNVLAKQMIKESGAEPAFLGYKPGGARRPYPATICASLNNVVVHGVPGEHLLKSGDILKIDLGVRYQGYCADAAISIGVGEVSPVARMLIHVTKKALDAAISIARPGNTLGDIGYVIQRTASDHGFKIIKGLTGHGIGKKLHEEPSIFNEGNPGEGLTLETGMVLAIEPMLSVGSARIKQLKDESYATVDGSLAGHFEHTILITERGAEVLTVL